MLPGLSRAWWPAVALPFGRRESDARRGDASVTDPLGAYEDHWRVGRELNLFNVPHRQAALAPTERGATSRFASSHASSLSRATGHGECCLMRRAWTETSVWRRTGVVMGRSGGETTRTGPCQVILLAWLLACDGSACASKASHGSLPSPAKHVQTAPTICSQPASFNAPTQAGNYRCDVHPTIMTGDLAVGTP
jgi:hypothetical protein